MQRSAKRILGIHAGLAMAELICVSAFLIELARARSGNTLSWAYVVLWPILAGYAVFVWHRLLHDDRATPTRGRREDEREDAARAEYNEYLRQIHDRDHKSDENS